MELLNNYMIQLKALEKLKYKILREFKNLRQ